MPGIPREFAEHSLETYPGAKPIKQTTRRLSVGEWFVLRQGTLGRKVRTLGAREQLATPLEKSGGKPREGQQWGHREFTQVQATLRCNTLLLLVWWIALGWWYSTRASVSLLVLSRDLPSMEVEDLLL